MRGLALGLRGNRGGGERHGRVGPGSLELLVRAVLGLQPASKAAEVGGRVVHPLVLVSAPHHPLLRRARGEVIPDDAIGVGRCGHVLEQPSQALDRVAAPGLRGPTRRRLAARVDQRHGMAIAGVQQHDVVRVLGAPPRRSVQIQPGEEIRPRVRLQQHLHATVELGVVELAGPDPDGLRQPVAGLGRRAAEGEQADAGSREIAEDFG